MTCPHVIRGPPARESERDVKGEIYRWKKKRWVASGAVPFVLVLGIEVGPTPKRTAVQDTEGVLQAPDDARQVRGKN